MKDLLIDEYLERVTRDMGPEQKREVENELRTHIMDSAEALASERKTAVNEAMIHEVLRGMMPPAQLAALYPKQGAFLQTKRLSDACKGLAYIATMFLLVAGILWLVSPNTLTTFPATVILSIVGALVVVFAIFTGIFTAMYLYDVALKRPYETRLKKLEKNINTKGRPLKVYLMAIFTAVWLAVLYGFWPIIPFPARLAMGTQIIPLLSQDFVGFLPWFILLGLLTIAVQLLYLIVRQQWLPPLGQAVMTACNATLHFWLLSVFPFNPGLSPGIQSCIKVFLAVLIMLMLINAAAKLRKTARLFRVSLAAKNQKEGSNESL